MHSMRRHHGFSLIELMLVIAIIAVVSAIAIPRYGNSLSTYRVSLAAKRIAADLQMAQARARMLSASRTVTFGNSSKYRIAGERDLRDSTTVYTVTLGDQPYCTTISSAQFGATAGTSSITFNGFGMPDNAGTITLSCGKATKTILVSAYDGGVTIQ
jgi:type II secretion system protein H